MIPLIKKLPNYIATTACLWWLMIVILAFTGQLDSHSKWMSFQVIMASVLAMLIFIWFSGELALWVYKMTPQGKRDLLQHRYEQIKAITTSDNALHNPDLGHLLHLQWKIQGKLQELETKKQSIS